MSATEARREPLDAKCSPRWYSPQMAYEEVTFSRDRLYEQVWARPVLAVAAAYGVSNVALAKICRRLGVRSRRAATGLGSRRDSAGSSHPCPRSPLVGRPLTHCAAGGYPRT